MNPHAALLEEMGGYVRVATMVGITSEAARKWKRRGIPPRYWHVIAGLKPSVTAEWLAETKPTRRAAKKRRRAAE